MAEMQFPPGQKQNVQSLKALDYPQAGGIVPRHPANDHNDGPRRVYMVYIYIWTIDVGCSGCRRQFMAP